MTGMPTPNFHGMEVMSLTEPDWQNFYHSCYSGDLAAVKELLLLRSVRKLFIANYQDSHGRTVIHVASWGGHLSTVRYLCDQRSAFELEITGHRVHAWLEATDENDWTPFYTACWWGKQMVAEFLIRFGADWTHKDKTGFNGLERTYMAGRKQTVEYLINMHIVPPDQGFLKALDREIDDQSAMSGTIGTGTLSTLPPVPSAGGFGR